MIFTNFFCRVYDGLEFPFVFINIVSFMYRIKCKKLDIYFMFDCSILFIPANDMLLLLITSHCIVGTLVTQFLFSSI